MKTYTRKPEVLAPVGGREQLIAAVRCGADAVYLGAKGFNARRNAENFDEMGLPEAVAYCHGRGVKVHVTVNILVMDSEMDDLIATLDSVAASGADAVIVQDLAVAKLLRERCPTLPMHASTQMAVHNLAGVRMLEKLGFTRVVLARELTLDEIAFICANTAMEIETFVHGALCMSVSGACYLSSMLGGRSGNRGLCAQPCRLNFISGKREYALSLKDMSYIKHVNALADAGVCALKIEGRMKRPEYVAAAVTACRAAIDGGDPDLETLEAVFSRSGFTDGYLMGKRNLSMFGIRRLEDAKASEKVLGKLSDLYRNERSHIPVDMKLFAIEDQESQLIVSDSVYTLSVSGAVPFIAENRPMDIDYVRRSLEKTGGTPFLLGNLSCEIGDNVMMAASELGRMRRDALVQLLDLRSRIISHEFASGVVDILPIYKPISAPLIRLRAERWEQIKELDFSTIEYVILPIGELIEHKTIVNILGAKCVAELPALIFPSDEGSLLQQISELQDLGLKNIFIENIGGLSFALCGLNILGGFGLNVLNTISLQEYARLGVNDITLSFELNAADITRLGGMSKRGLVAYGRLPLMRFRCCPVQQKGCVGCNGISSLTDRKNISFPVICARKKYSSLLNSLPLYVFDRKFVGIDFMTIYITTETPEECQEIFALCKSKESAPFERTRGLYFREVK